MLDDMRRFIKRLPVHNCSAFMLLCNPPNERSWILLTESFNPKDALVKNGFLKRYYKNNKKPAVTCQSSLKDDVLIFYHSNSAIYITGGSHYLMKGYSLIKWKVFKWRKSSKLNHQRKLTMDSKYFCKKRLSDSLQIQVFRVKHGILILCIFVLILSKDQNTESIYLQGSKWGKWGLDQITTWKYIHHWNVIKFS